MNNLKVLSLFSGIGAFERALDNLEIDYELINYSDNDNFASKSYSIINNISEELNLGDITKVDETALKDFDLLTYGFPCQSFSILGKQLGFSDLEKGNLFFDVMRIAKYKKPKYMIAENVDNLLTHNKGDTFKVVIDTLDKLGYNNHYKVLNSIDFNIPQSRKRIFIVSIRRDIDSSFKFPEGTRTTKTVSDFLDDGCTKRDIANRLIPYLDTQYHKETKTINGIIKVFDGMKQGYLTYGHCTGRICSIYGNSPTLTTDKRTSTFLEIKGELNNKERLRLQGFTDIDYSKLKGIISENQLYKQTGNSITVSVIQSILKNLFLL